MHSIESKFVIGPSDIMFPGVCVCCFQPGNFTGCGSEGVKIIIMPCINLLTGPGRVTVGGSGLRCCARMKSVERWFTILFVGSSRALWVYFLIQIRIS